MSTQAKDQMIDLYRKEAKRDEEYESWLDWLDQQPEQQARLMEHCHFVPSQQEEHHAEIQH